VTPAWRIADARWGGSLGGEGGLYASGRWHRQGVRVVYLSGTMSLAALEVLVHHRRTDLRIPFVSVRIEIPEDVAIETLPPEQLPAEWRSEPISPATQQIGMVWLSAARTALLRVPSAVIPEEHNYVLNALHPDSARLKVAAPEPFTFDPRLRR